MRALLVVPRLPGTGFTGDRVRAELHLAALRRAGFSITLLGGSPAGAEPVRPEGVDEVVAVPLRRASVPWALAKAFVAGDPLQSADLAGPWGEALERAGSRFDLVVWSLVRSWPHLRGRLPEAPAVLDYIDALGEAARQAAGTDPALWRRLYWRLDAPRLLRAEREAATSSRALLATTPFDASCLPAGTVAIPNGVPIGPAPPDAERLPVVAFSGRLRYRPNELAVERLVREIWPRVRQAVPGAELRIGGADAGRSIRALHGREGISVESPVPEMPAFLRRARVVAAPVTLGTGTPNKLFEAFEAGAAVVASEDVAARAAVDGVAPPATIARGDEEFAAALVGYLADPARARADGLRGRAFVQAHADRSRSVERFAAVFLAAAAAS